MNPGTPTSQLTAIVVARRPTKFLLLLLLLPLPAGAHPFLNNTWQVLAESNRLAMRVTATLREVAVSQGLAPSQLTNLPTLRNAVSNHSAYVASHLLVEIGGEAVPIEVLDHQLLLEDSVEPEDSDKYPDLTHAAYDLECRFPTAATARSTPGPLRARFRHRTLEGHNYAPGIPWDPFYVLLVADSNRRSLGQDIVRLNAAVTIDLPPTAPSTPTVAVSAPAPSPATNHPSAKVEHPPAAAPGFAAFGPFLRHGLHHVLTGYDHLLFLAALALASRSWRRLLAIIGIFTLAHSITVTLAALGWVRLPPSMVEPIIAGSIVFVALQNVLAPAGAAGSSRLAVAFGFGLIHGLGFAGGLREVLEQSPTSSLAITILAFCIGVELGHLAVGAPLFGIFKALRKPSPEPSATPGVTPLERWSSVAVAAGGAWFLWAALRSI